jgi:hypothetical protein
MRGAGIIGSIIALSVQLVLPASSLAGSQTVYEESREEVGAIEERVITTVRVQEDPAIEPDGISIIADFLIARPLGLVATVVGTTVYILAFPFAALAGDVRTPAEMLVAEPARFTFDRPLGAIDL